MINILRLDHRIVRDKRITTHVSLVARAFGANKIFITGDHDHSIENSVRNIVQEWGGDFQIEFTKNWKTIINNHKKNKFKIVHLTMYGEQIQDCITELKTHEDILIVVGGAKVPPDIYAMVDYNVSVTTQPHSEVAALGLILHMLFESKELHLDFKGKKKIEPCRTHKKKLIE